MLDGVKDGDSVEAKELVEEGEKAGSLKGVLHVLHVPEYKMGLATIPAFDAYFINGKEADAGTIKKVSDPDYVPKEKEKKEQAVDLAVRAGVAMSYFGMQSVLDTVIPSLEFANPYHDERGRFTTGPEEETGGKGGGVESDLATKKGIEIGSHISFIPQGGSRAVT